VKTMAGVVQTFSRLQKIESACLPKDDPAPGERSWGSTGHGQDHSVAKRERGVGWRRARCAYCRCRCAALAARDPPCLTSPPLSLVLPPAPQRTTVYLLDEILELARASPEQAQGVADAVERKLGSKSPVVKFKVGSSGLKSLFSDPQR
jgi:hypothetical protein